MPEPEPEQDSEVDDSELSRRFAARGGRARARNLSPAKLRKIARKAGVASGKARRKKARERKKAKRELEKKEKGRREPAPGKNQSEGTEKA